MTTQVRITVPVGQPGGVRVRYGSQKFEVQIGGSVTVNLWGDHVLEIREMAAAPEIELPAPSKSTAKRLETQRTK